MLLCPIRGESQLHTQLRAALHAQPRSRLTVHAMKFKRTHDIDFQDGNTAQRCQKRPSFRYDGPLFLLRRAADWRLPPVDCDPCPYLLNGRDNDWTGQMVEYYLLIHPVSFTLPFALILRPHRSIVRAQTYRRIGRTDSALAEANLQPTRARRHRSHRGGLLHVHTT